MEPFGDHIADLRHGSATSVLANISRNPATKPEPFKAEDFIFWRETGNQEEVEPMLIDDPVAQSNLIRAAMFGITPK